MSNVIFGYNNIVENSSLTSLPVEIIFETNLPRDNLKTDKLAELAQTTTNASVTIVATFSSNQTVGCIALANHNFVSTCEIDIVVRSGPLGTDPILDSVDGVLAPYIDSTRNNIVCWWLSANVTTAQRVEVSIHNPTITAGSFIVGTSYVIVSVGTTDFTSIGAASNTVGVTFTATGVGTGTGTAKVGTDYFYSIGRLFIGKQFELERNADYGNASHGKVDLSDSTKTINGVKWSRQRAKLRTASIGIGSISESEMLIVDDLMQISGTTEDVIYAYTRPTYTDTAGVLHQDELSYKRTFIGNLSSLDSINTPFFGRYSAQFSIEELAV